MLIFYTFGPNYMIRLNRGVTVSSRPPKENKRQICFRTLTDRRRKNLNKNKITHGQQGAKLLRCQKKAHIPTGKIVKNCSNVIAKYC